MSYHSLTEDTGHKTMEDRVHEALMLVQMLIPYRAQMLPRESQLVVNMSTATTCTPGQLFWLRDLKDKYL